MTLNEKVRAHFEKLAGAYEARSNCFPWSSIRDRESRAFLSILGSVSGREVLELGSGAGHYTRKLLAAGARHVWAVDFSPAMLASLPRGCVTPIEADAATFSLERRFSVIASAGMLEFTPDPAAVLANAARHAEPAARFVLLVPRTNWLGRFYAGYHARHGISISCFDEAWFETAITATGWRVAGLTNIFPFSLVVRLERT